MNVPYVSRELHEQLVARLEAEIADLKTRLDAADSERRSLTASVLASRGAANPYEPAHMGPIPKPIGKMSAEKILRAMEASERAAAAEKAKENGLDSAAN